jgi:hypothetical protein
MDKESVNDIAAAAVMIVMMICGTILLAIWMLR